MASKWTWNGIDLWVSEQDINREVKRAELFVIDATVSEFQHLGSGSRKYNLKGLVIGTTNRDSLETDCIGDTSRSLVTPWGTLTTLKINAFKANAKLYSGATIGGVTYTSDVTPIYEFTMELIDV